jgi:Xaa-Pro aminopeptidase
MPTRKGNSLINIFQKGNMKPKEKITKLRNLMQDHQIDAWIVPSADPHQSEYVAEHWKARAWLSGFTGSAGIVVVTLDKAGLWTDPRYHIRAAKELQGSGIKLYKFGLLDVPSYIEWLQNELGQEGTIGFDGNILSVTEVEKINQAFDERQFTLSFQHDLIGKIWQERPEIPMNQIFLHDIHFAGESRISKFQRIRTKLKGYGAQAHLLTMLDDIAWTFNIRGSDVAYNPVAISYAAITENEAYIFISDEKVPREVKEALAQDGVIFFEYEDIIPFLETFEPGTSILVDPEKTSYKLRKAIPENCSIRYGDSIPHRLKAIKNKKELEGISKAHVRDGVALVKWMYWLDQHITKGNHTEITVAEKLEDFRSIGEHFQGLSFNTISGYQANAAIGHYSSNPETTPTLKPEGILLIDSGAQYLDGTTDITRTLTLGSPTPDEKQAFTLVLKCHIRLAQTKFPKGTKGYQLDMIAREPLWRLGWNCRHGIGHGVGYFLNVHEGPQRFRDDNSVAFEPGMVTSNEPGVYFEGKYGFRIENVVITIPVETTAFGEFFGFKTVSLCPIDLELVEVSLLNPDEKAWLNDYHKTVNTVLRPFLTEDEQEWLQHETREI